MRFNFFTIMISGQMKGNHRTACLARGYINGQKNKLWAKQQGLKLVLYRPINYELADKTRNHTQTDNMQFLVWPVYRAFTRQQLNRFMVASQALVVTFHLCVYNIYLVMTSEFRAGHLTCLPSQWNHERRLWVPMQKPCSAPQATYTLQLFRK